MTELIHGMGPFARRCSGCGAVLYVAEIYICDCGITACQACFNEHRCDHQEGAHSMSSEKEKATWFKLSPWSDEIESCEVLKVTEHFVTVVGRDWQGRKIRPSREARKNYFETWEAAHAAALLRAQREVDNAESRLARAKEKLAKAQALRHKLETKES